MVEEVDVWSASLQQAYPHLLEYSAVAMEPERVMLIERRGGAGKEEYEEECSNKQRSVCQPVGDVNVFHDFICRRRGVCVPED